MVPGDRRSNSSTGKFFSSFVFELQSNDCQLPMNSIMIMQNDQFMNKFIMSGFQ